MANTRERRLPPLAQVELCAKEPATSASAWFQSGHGPDIKQSHLKASALNNDLKRKIVCCSKGLTNIRMENRTAME